MSEYVAQWRVPMVPVSPGQQRFMRILTLLVAVLLLHAIWRYLTTGEGLVRLIVLALLLLLDYWQSRHPVNVAVRATERALVVPAFLHRRHIPWSEIEDIRPDHPPPWGTRLVAVRSSGTHTPIPLPPDHEELRAFWRAHHAPDDLPKTE